MVEITFKEDWKDFKKSQREYVSRSVANRFKEKGAKFELKEIDKPKIVSGMKRRIAQVKKKNRELDLA